MQCQHAQELFSDYIDDRMELALKVSLENHLATCESCREEVEGLRTVWTALDEMPRAELPLYFHENLMSRIAAEEAQGEEAAARKRALWDWRALFRPRSLAFAAIGLLIVLVGVEVRQTNRAAIGPFGWVMQLVRPTQSVAPAPQSVAPALEAKRATWTAGESGGMLTVTLKPNASPTPFGYRILVDGQVIADSSGNFVAGKEAEVKIPLPQPPGKDSVSVELTGTDGKPLPDTKSMPLSVN